MNSSVVSHGASRRDEQRQVLGHLAALDGLDADLLQRVGELGHRGGLVQLAAVLEAPVQAKIEAIGLVEVFSPFCHCR